MEQKHTPTPWEILGGDDKYIIHHCSDGGLIVEIAKLIRTSKYKANAEFIVRSANEFYNFIEVCHSALDKLQNGGNPDETIQALKEILARTQSKTLSEV